MFCDYFSQSYRDSEKFIQNSFCKERTEMFVLSAQDVQLPPPILTTFYRGTMKSILINSISVWSGSCSKTDRKTVPRVVRTAEKIIGISLPFIKDIAGNRCLSGANNMAYPTHPSHGLYTLLPSAGGGTLA